MIKNTTNFTIFSALLLACAPVWQPALGDEVFLEDQSLIAAFDKDSGALTRMESKTKHWFIERRPELGVSFRLFAPLPDRRWNPVLGQNQKAVSVKKISSNEVWIRWKNLASESGGILAMTLTADVTLTNGALTFNATLQNDSALTIETIDYPYLGDLNPPARTTTLEMRVMTNNLPGHFKSDEIYPHFGNEKGYWGVFWPLKTCEAQQSRFCAISSPDQGLYVEMEEPKTPYRMQYTFEQHPGVISAINHLVPPEDEISGTPVHLEFRTCHFIFAAPHSTTNLAPIVLRCYQGDWHSGVDLYKQ